MTYHFLTPQEVLRLYQTIEISYGYDPIPPRDTLLIELACARPQMTNYGDVQTHIAVFLESVMAFRPFSAHTTATAFAALASLLEMNNLRLASSPSSTQKIWTEWEAQSPDYLKIATWLRLVTEPIS